MKQGWLVAGLLFASGTVHAQGGCTKVVVTADPEYPPYAWYDGQTLRGASVDVVLAAAGHQAAL